jgi:hypothetical protein
MENREFKFLPDIILAGAPKCGTTSVYDYLSGHPEICPSSVKETYFLMDPDYPLAREISVHKAGLKGYERYFSQCYRDSNKLQLEATPDYLYQSTPLASFSEWPKLPRVFFILRKPEERVYSLYKFAKGNMAIIRKDMMFAEFLQRVENNDFGQDGNIVLENSIEHSKYINYLLKWRSVLGSDRIGLFLFEELVEMPDKFMRKVCAFLGIDPSYYDTYNFTASNRSYNVKSQALHRVKKKLSNIIPKSVIKTSLSTLYMKLNTMHRNERSVDEKIELIKLHDEFNKYNLLLEKEFDIELTRWNKDF